MIFKGLRKFAGNEFSQVTRYLSGNLSTFVNDLVVGLSKLSFGHNFDCFLEDVTLAHSAQVEVVNRFGTIAVDVMFMNNTQPFQVFSITADKITVENFGGVDGFATVVVMRGNRQ